MQYDTLIIGAGPAGLSAAITLRARNKNVLVVGPIKQGEHIINNYLGLPRITEGVLFDRFITHAKSAGAEHTEDRATAVYAVGESFSVQCASGKMYQAATVVIACGVSPEKPIDGEEELLGQGVSYCVTCDGMLYKDKKVAAVVYNNAAESDMQFLKEVCASVEIINAKEEKPNSLKKIHLPTKVSNTTSDAQIADSSANAQNSASSTNSKTSTQIYNFKDLSKFRSSDLTKILLKTPKRDLRVDGVFIFRDSIALTSLVPGVETEGRHIKVSGDHSTNLPGCFACGDCIGKPYQIAKAAGEGNVVALNVVKYLSKENF